MSFRIDGEGMAELIREFGRDFSWEEGLRFATNCVPGLQTRQAFAIMRGLKTFVGDSKDGIDMVDAPPELAIEWDAFWSRRWAGTWYVRPNTYWRPYALVNGWGPLDVPGSLEWKKRFRNKNHHFEGPAPVDLPNSSAIDAMRRFTYGRHVAYMTDPANDRAEICVVPDEAAKVFDTKSTMILWSEVKGSPPLWMPRFATAQEAFVDYLAAGLPLEVRNHANWFPDWEPIKRDKNLTDKERDAINARHQLRQIRQESKDERAMAARPPEVPSVAEAMEEHFPPEPPKPNLTPTSKPLFPYAWIDREGRFWEVPGYLQHVPTAESIAGHLGFRVPGEPAERTLEKKGWLKCRQAWRTHPEIQKPPPDFNWRPSPAQKASAIAWLLHWGAARDQFTLFED